MTATHSILVRGVNWLGDAVMSTPALLRLREHFPGAHITLLTPEKLIGLWVGHPAVDETLSIPPGAGPWNVSRHLRSRGFTLALVLPNSFRSALEVWLAGIPHRIGYDGGWRKTLLPQPVGRPAGLTTMRKRSEPEIRRLAREPGGGAAYTVAPGSHHVFHYLRLAAAMGAKPELTPPLLVVAESEVAGTRRKFKIDASGRPLVAINPGAEYGPAKRWLIENFVSAATRVQAEFPCRWVILGGRNDRELAGHLAVELRKCGSNSGGCAVTNVAGETTLRELCALLRASRLLLTNDTGPMHVAAALGTPVVVPFGSTSAALTGPSASPTAAHKIFQANVPCTPCFLRECPIDFRCMKSITPELVSRAMIEIILRTSADSPGRG